MSQSLGAVSRGEATCSGFSMLKPFMGDRNKIWLRALKLFQGRVLLSVGESRCLVALHTKMEAHLLPTRSQSGVCPLEL